MTTPIFEAYWESWNKGGYCSQLSEVPMGLGNGKVNVIDLAFGNYSYSKDGQGITIGYLNDQITPDQLQQDVVAIHQSAGKVKLSLGGATFSMGSVVKDETTATQLAKNTAAACQRFNLDGVDFDIEDGSTNAKLQLVVFQQLRAALGPNALISYTIPAMAENIDPWKTVITQGSQYFSSINVMCYDYYWSGYKPQSDFAQLQSMGVAANKIVWGVMPGHADDPSEYVTPQDAINIANEVKTTNLGGVMIWDVNRDTNHRPGHPGDNVYETGLPDGTFINAISSALR